MKRQRIISKYRVVLFSTESRANKGKKKYYAHGEQEVNQGNIKSLFK